MPDPIANIITSFILGVLTPLTAVCVLPLYPAFLSYIGGQYQNENSKNKPVWVYGVVIVLGVLTFMTLLGLVFTTILQVSLNSVIGIVSPIAFFVLGIISILLIFNVDFGKFFPRIQAPVSKSPIKGSFIYGFFFGAIVVPCNPAFIAALFTQVSSQFGFAFNMLNFFSFGIGMGAPLLIFSLISVKKSKEIIGFLTAHTRTINLLSGITMLIISIYYLVVVFGVFGPIF